LDSELVIEFAQADSGVNGTIYAIFSQAFTSFIVPAKETVNSGPIPNVLLTHGALNTLNIIPYGVLDVATAVTARMGPGGYQ
ncbi:hypothetical protein BDN72DRAFT_734503, partial [Pluteus cervinus]